GESQRDASGCRPVHWHGVGRPEGPEASTDEPCGSGPRGRETADSLVDLVRRGEAESEAEAVRGGRELGPGDRGDTLRTREDLTRVRHAGELQPDEVTPFGPVPR